MRVAGAAAREMLLAAAAAHIDAGRVGPRGLGLAAAHELRPALEGQVVVLGHEGRNLVGLVGAELLRRSIAEARVAFVPGSAFHADRSGRNTLRLNFSLASEKTIAEGVGRLGKLLRT